MATTRLPSLKALRAFEAAARHGSLTAAARELYVTPAAISHQIKGLEADLGVALMTRVGSDYRLSETARSALPLLRGGFDQIAEAVRLLRSDEAARLLTITVGTTFASTWLVGRLGRFKAAAPDVEVRLHTTDRVVDFARDGVDVAIRFGPGDYRGLTAIRLFDEEIYPVCSPRLLETGPPLETPADLARHTLLHVEWTLHRGETFDWESWLRAAGAAEVDFSRGPRFSHTSIALIAAEQGQGLALGSDALAADALAAGRLIRPFALSLPLAFAYHLVYPEAHGAVPKIAAFRDWILVETGRAA
jgi:LysR family glycine cleavage system transcriptional activator